MWECHGQRRTGHCGQHAQRAVGRQEAGAGVSGGEDSVCAAAGDQIGRDLHRRARLATQRRERRFVHRDGFGRLDNGDCGRDGEPKTRELLAYDRCGADQRDGETGTRGRLNRAGDDRGWRPVTAHRVNGDCDH